MAGAGEGGVVGQLRRHVPAVAVEWDIDAPGRRWRSVEGTLCFADISGFTALSERLAQRGRVGAEELVETLSAVFGGMLERARDRDGELLKFGGDALLFLFTGEGHAVRAAAAAVELRAALREAAKMPTSVGPLRLAMSVGLHSGEILLALTGSSHRELVLVGPAATITAETEAAAEAGQIAVSSGTAARLPPEAVAPRADGTLLLTWRRPPHPAAGPTPPRPVEDHVVRGLFPGVLGAVLDPGPPDPEHRVASIAFIRFSGTDALLAERGPDAVAAALEGTLGPIMDVLVDEGLTLLAVDLDRDGGKVFLASGVPHATEDDEGRILRGLARIVRSVLPLAVQAGVNRGHVFVAEIGRPWRAAYSAMGDTTNTAARICAKADPGRLYAHPSVLQHSRTLFDAAPVGPFQFKGKQQPMVVYDVGEEIGTRGASDAGELLLVGRDAELAVLREALEERARGRGGVVAITGASGLGKSRLLAEAVRAAGDVPTVSVRAEPYGANSPYRALRDPVRALLGVERGDAAAMSAALVAAVDRLAPALLPYAPLLGDVAHVEVPGTAEVDAIDPQFRPERVADVVVELLAARHPEGWIGLIEDAHWADEASAHLLGCLAAATAGRPWLLLVSRRGGDTGFLPATGTALVLAPLPQPAVRTLVLAATAAAPLRPHLVDEITARAAGNPLFVVEIARTARELGTLDAIPDSLHAALATQVDALDPIVRRLLRCASVLGQSFRRAVLDEVARADELVADAATLEEAAVYLDADGADRLRFRNGLMRDALYEGLAYRVRARLHRAAGEALERLSADVDVVADALALHFWRAGDASRTWRYARTAADRARDAYANSDAAVQYERALEAARRLPDVGDTERARAWTDLGDVRELAGDFEASLDAYRRASALVRHDPVAIAELLLRRARARERSGAFSAALREVTVGLRLLAPVRSDAATRLQARMVAFAALVRLGQERNRDAHRGAAAAVSMARAVEERAALAQALMVFELAEIELHGPGDGRHLREALDLFVALNDLPREAQARGNLGFLAAYAGRWDEAVEWFTTCRTAYERAGDAVGGAIAALNLGEMLVNQGRGEESRPLLDDARRVMRATGFAEGVARAELQLARLAVEDGDLAAADALLDEVDHVYRSLGQSSSLLEAALVRAEALLARGSPHAALTQLADAEAHAGREAEAMGPRLALVRAQALLAAGDAMEASDVVSAGLSVARRRGMPFEEALLLRLRGRVARDRGGESDPLDDQAANDILEGLGVRSTSAVT
jgi:class 3 adenylate cyclase/tetratricopeptide (TPR) repeat protein